jgi:hypothetical protein
MAHVLKDGAGRGAESVMVCWDAAEDLVPVTIDRKAKYGKPGGPASPPP